MASEKFETPKSSVDILFSTAKSIWPGSTSTHKLLLRAANETASSCTIIERRIFGPCILVLSPIPSGGKWTFTQVVELLDETLGGELDCCVDFTFEHISKDRSQSKTFLAVLGPLPQEHLKLDILNQNDKRQWDRESLRTPEELSDYFTPTKRQFPLSTFFKWSSAGARSSILGLCVFLSIAILGAMLIAYQNTQHDQTLIQYDVGNSIGPKYTSLLTPDNITAWAEKHYNPQDWYIRIDDQALIPIELMDEQEWRYQEYLSKRYPEKAELRDSGAWRDLNFLSDPNNFMLPSDMEFHTGHCIRAIRRYWQAKETGRHVCPWDVDYLHLRHCFSMLESVMLPPGPRDDSMVVGMSWRTKVCMWEP